MDIIPLITFIVGLGLGFWLGSYTKAHEPVTFNEPAEPAITYKSMPGESVSFLEPVTQKEKFDNLKLKDLE
jgi:hypothetical protein